MANVIVDTEGLWPGVYAVAADADIYCLPCARRLYGEQSINWVVSPPMDFGGTWPVDHEGNCISAILASEEQLENVYCGASDHEEVTGYDTLLCLGSGYVDSSSEPVVVLHESEDGGLEDADGAAFYRYDMRGYVDCLYGESCERCHCGLDQTAYVCLDGGNTYCDDCVTVEG